MKFSCTTRWAANLPIQQTLTAIQAAGYPAAELFVTADDELPASPLPYSGIVIHGLLGSGREREWLTRRTGIHSVTLTAGPRRECSIDKVREQLRELVDLARTHEVGIELVNASNSRLEQLEDFRELLAGNEWPDVQLVLDAVEFHRASVNPAAALREWSDRLSRVIVGDLIGNRRVPLGDGEVGIAALLDQARRADQVSISIDPCVQTLTSPNHDLATEGKRMEQIFGL